LLRRSTTTNAFFADRDHLVASVRSGLCRIQLQSLIDDCLAETGLSLNTTTQRKGQ